MSDAFAILKAMALVKNPDIKDITRLEPLEPITFHSGIIRRKEHVIPWDSTGPALVILHRLEYVLVLHRAIERRDGHVREQGYLLLPVSKR